MDRLALVEDIQPSQHYDYWQFCWTGFRTIRTIYSRGDYNKAIGILPKISPDNGFFRACEPGHCFNYILAVKEDSVTVINSNQALAKFIGRIDNLGEALLTARINELFYSNKYKETSSYKFNKDYYDLYLLDYTSCPETFYSVKTKLAVTGEFKIESKKVIEKTGNCYIH